MSTTNSLPSRCPLRVIGRGATTDHFLDENGAKVDAWKLTPIREGRQHGRLPEPEVIVDLTLMEWDALFTLAVNGPMHEAGIPNGMLRKPFSGDLTRFDPTPDPARPAHCAPLGNARAFDYCALDVYIRLAESLGAKVTSPKEANNLLSTSPSPPLRDTP